MRTLNIRARKEKDRERREEEKGTERKKYEKKLINEENMEQMCERCWFICSDINWHFLV